MLDRRRLVRVVAWAGGILGVLLVAYLGSFAVIRWTKPRFLINGSTDRPRLAYQLTYWPLRWVTARRPAFMPLWRTQVSVRGVYEGDPQYYPVFVTVDGVTYRFDPPVGFDASHLRPGDSCTLQVDSSLESDEDFSDFRRCRLVRIEP